jgi:hypothetical protein
MKASTISQFVVVILVGILGSYLYSVQRAYSAETFYIGYSIIAGLIFTLVGTMTPWKWIPVLFVAYYLSGYAFNQNWGQLGLFDLIFMAIYSIPCLIASYALIYIKKILTKHQTST